MPRDNPFRYVKSDIADALVRLGKRQRFGGKCFICQNEFFEDVDPSTEDLALYDPDSDMAEIQCPDCGLWLFGDRIEVK